MKIYQTKITDLTVEQVSEIALGASLGYLLAMVIIATSIFLFHKWKMKK